MASFKRIATTTLSNSTTSSVTLSNIPSFFSHLRISVTAKTLREGGVNGGFRFNANSSAVYSLQRMYSSWNYDDQHGGYVRSNSDGNSGVYFTGILQNIHVANTDVASVWNLDIPNYSTSNNPKPGMMFFGGATTPIEFGYPVDSGFQSFNFNQPTAISSVTFHADFDNSAVYWRSGSKFTIYGLE